jgi:cobalt-zinc-cadmium efflux system membrane fusion protein
MKNINKIAVAFLSVATLISCGEKHAEGDGHNHEKPGEEQQVHEEGEHSDVTSLSKEQIRAVGIEFGEIESKNLTATIKANGLLRVPNNNKANVTSLYGGVIKTLNVQLGDYVRKGQVIATIENPQFIRLQEEYLTIGSQIIYAEQELQRQRELNENNAGAGRNLQNAISELNTLTVRKASLQQQIQLMGIDPKAISDKNLKSALVVTSPISGTISNVFAKIGSYTDVSSSVAEVVDNGSLHVDINVFEKDLPLLKVGQTIHFTLTNNPVNEYDAAVFSIGAAFENESKTIPVHAKVKGNKAGLIDGMNITAIVSLNNVRTPAVPDGAIVNADGKYYVFVQTEEGDDHGHEKRGTFFKKVEVIKGVSDVGYTAITPVSKIADKTRIAVKGAYFINAKMTDTGGHEH